MPANSILHLSMIKVILTSEAGIIMAAAAGIDFSYSKRPTLRHIDQYRLHLLVKPEFFLFCLFGAGILLIR